MTTPRRRYMGMGSHLAAVTCDHTDNKFVDIDGQNVKLFIVNTTELLVLLGEVR